MTPDEAVNLLDEMAAATTANRPTHAAALEAVQTLRALLAAKADEADT